MNNKFQPKSERRNNSIENFNLNRGMDIYLKNEKNFQMLNDRDMFGQFSNGNEQIDMSSFKPNENTHGMPLFNPQILQNKKGLLNNPYIQESNDQTHFRALNTMTNTGSSMYAHFGNNDNNDDNASVNSDGGFTMGRFSGFDKINGDTKITKSNDGLNDNSLVNSFDSIEKGIIIYECSSNFSKNKTFTMDITSPFALSFLWKSIVLLSKNPSTDKILKMLNIKKKDDILNDMKYYSDVFNDMGSLEYVIPYGSGMLNTNFTKRLNDVYKIKVNGVNNSQQFVDNTSENAQILLNFKFELKIPYYYQPNIVVDYLLDYNNNKIKFLKLINVPCALEIDRDLDAVNLEIPIGDEMILGFMYNLNRKNIENTDLLYSKINKKRTIDRVVKELYIPKINRNKKINYGKKFVNDLKQIHLGEIIYGNMYDIDIIVDMILDITVDNNVSTEKYQIVSNIDEIKINHRCFFYTKNKNIENRILFSGIIEY